MIDCVMVTLIDTAGHEASQSLPGDGVFTNEADRRASLSVRSSASGAGDHVLQSSVRVAGMVEDTMLLGPTR